MHFKLHIDIYLIYSNDLTSCLGIHKSAQQVFILILLKCYWSVFKTPCWFSSFNNFIDCYGWLQLMVWREYQEKSAKEPRPFTKALLSSWGWTAKPQMRLHRDNPDVLTGIQHALYINA